MMRKSMEDRLWALAQERGMDRRRFLGLLLAGGAAAVLAACGADSPGSDSPTTATTSPAGDTSPAATAGWFKDPSPFIEHPGGKSLEARLENMPGLITSDRFFFVRNNSVSVAVDVADWRLSIEGDAVANPLTLSYAAIRELPRRTLVAYLECAGNHRGMFDRVLGQAADGTQWGTGGISNGEWSGVSLREVLELAGIRSEAVSVLLIGMDVGSPEEGFRRVLPVDRAMHPDTLLAYSLNGEALPRDHGFPLRALVPGWVGSSSIKWLNRILVSSEQIWTRNNTTSYTLIGDAYPPEGESMGRPVTRQTIKSALALPWPAQLEAGSQRIHGYAQSPDGPITRVEWSDDSGNTWHDATVLEPQVQYSWARFEFVWEAAAGEHTIMTRATDRAGETHPDSIPFNAKGYLFNQPAPHPIQVL